MAFQRGVGEENGNFETLARLLAAKVKVKTLVWLDGAPYRISTVGDGSAIELDNGLFANSLLPTTLELINSTASYATSAVISTTGFTTIGDGGGGEWKLTGNTITASQTPSQTGNGTCSDGNGKEFSIVITGDLDPRQLGATLVDGILAIRAAVEVVSVSGNDLNLNGLEYTLTKFLNLKGGYKLKNGSFFLPATLDVTGSENFGGVLRAVYSKDSFNLSMFRVTFRSTRIGLTHTISVATENVSGLDVQLCTFKDFGDGSHYAQGLVVFNGSDVTINKSLFDNCSGDGLAVAEGAKGVLVTGNTSRNNDDWGIVASNRCKDVRFAYNLVHDNSSVGIGFDEVTRATLIGNISYDNEYGIRVARFGATTDDQNYMTISDNVILRALVVGLEIESSTADSQTAMSNNIITDSNIGLQVSNMEGFTITGGSIINSTNESLRVISFGVATGNGTITGVRIVGGTHGIRQVNSGGSLLDINVMANFVDSPIRYEGIQGPLIGNGTDKVVTNLAFGYDIAITSSSATTGGGGKVLPNFPTGFLDIFVDGVKKKLPFYDD